MRGHVDAESLALYAEGELSRGRTARIRAHLSVCPECGATLATLAEVTTQLSHVPAPAMPSAVTARLDAALSAEAAHRAAAPSAPAPAPAGAPSPRPPRRNPIWSPAALRIVAGTAVTLVVAGGVGYAVSQFSGSSPSPSTASAPSGATRSAVPSSGHRIQGAPFVSPGAAERPNTGSSSGTPYVQSGTDYRRGTLAVQAKGQLAEYTVPGVSGPHRFATAKIPAPMSTCARQLAHGRPLLLVDLARYQGVPAYVIVLGKPDTAVAASQSCLRLHSAPLP